MKVSFSETSLNNTHRASTNFGLTHCDSVKLLKRVGNEYMPIAADIWEFHSYDKKDISFMKTLVRKWGVFTDYFYQICGDFLNNRVDSKFYATQIRDKNKAKITGLMELSTGFFPGAPVDKLRVDYIQAAPEIADKHNDAPIKGSGELLLYEAAKVCKKEDTNGFFLYSTNDRFYERVGLDVFPIDCGYNRFYLDACRLDEFMKKIEEKYNFNL